MANKNFLKLQDNKNFKLTSLRSDILQILFDSNKAIGAYDILAKLKKQRPNAEPMTVYRVLDYLVKAKLAHRVESQNTFVCCSSLVEEKNHHKAILHICSSCGLSQEFEDKNIFLAIDKFAKANALEVDDTLLEIKGICNKCSTRKSSP